MHLPATAVAKHRLEYRRTYSHQPRNPLSCFIWLLGVAKWGLLKMILVYLASTLRRAKEPFLKRSNTTEGICL